VRDATKFAPHCPQLASPFGQASTSEDCLFLNVFTPATGGHHPVMVWIHGGALVTGESDDYTPAGLVADGVTVVTINYRLGALGFLAHPALADANGQSGDYGLMDQPAALRCGVRQPDRGLPAQPARLDHPGQRGRGRLHPEHQPRGAAGVAGDRVRHRQLQPGADHQRDEPR
jgi:Carboxylesterase family